LSTTPRPEYPRPQLRRPDWTNLNGEWAFAFDDEGVGLEERWWETMVEGLGDPGASPFDRKITVPFCYQAELSGIGEKAFHDDVWYARTFRAPPLGEDERLLLHFGAVDYRATVWVNGTQVVRHEGGHTPFSADVTHALNGTPEGSNVVVVRAEDPSRDVTIPRGKQYWKEESEGIFYTRTTGIWQTVWMEPVPARRVDRLRLTPDVDAASLDVQVSIEGFEPGMALRVVVGREGERVLDDRLSGLRSALVERRLPLLARGEPHESPYPGRWARPALWSPGEPNLYDLRLELLDENGNVLDAVDSYFGMRKIEVRGGKVYLNNRPLYQRLVLDQGYFPGGLLTAPTDGDLRRDIELAKEMGFNGARKHQKVEDPRWLYWADTLGFLVWGEAANAYAYSPGYVRRLTAEWQEVVERDRNHPSVVVWVPMNESWGVPEIEADGRQAEHLLAMYHLTRSLDPSRPVVSNDGWEHAVTDLCTIHDYRNAAALARIYETPESAVREPERRPVYAPGYGYRGEPVLVTEFGGITMGRVTAESWGYRTVADAEGLLERYADLVFALVGSEVVQGFCYTQLTDVEQETNGLLTFDRRPKAQTSRIREITTTPRRPGEGSREGMEPYES
jgi:beta-galactosidase/beta-glucuronidase